MTFHVIKEDDDDYLFMEYEEWSETARYCLKWARVGRLSEKEVRFLTDILAKRVGRHLSIKQERWLYGNHIGTALYNVPRENLGIMGKVGLAIYHLRERYGVDAKLHPSGLVAYGGDTIVVGLRGAKRRVAEAEYDDFPDEAA